MLFSAVFHFVQMLRHQMLCGKAQSLLFKITRYPVRIQETMHKHFFGIILRGKGFQVKVWSPAAVMNFSRFIDGDKLHTTGNGPFAANAVADGVIEHKHDSGHSTHVIGINQYGPLFELTM